MTKIATSDGYVIEVTVYELTANELGIHQIGPSKIAAYIDTVEKTTIPQRNFLETDIDESAVREVPILDLVLIKSSSTKGLVRAAVRRSQLTDCSPEKVGRLHKISHDSLPSLDHARVWRCSRQG
ncbi:hypothetical protein YTPLAS72_15570 [Nitrospira sp.]|nr:hypothetical protein YTPLAS72_15570 [Nitrospira sp.]